MSLRPMRPILVRLASCPQIRFNAYGRLSVVVMAFRKIIYRNRTKKNEQYEENNDAQGMCYVSRAVF